MSEDRIVRHLLLSLGSILAGTVFWIDYITLGQFSIYLFYFPFIMSVTWYVGRSAGYLSVFLCSLAWSFTHMNSQPMQSQTVLFWSILIRLMTFSFIAWITVHLKGKQDHLLVLKERLNGLLEVEKNLSREDPLTGAMNWRAFEEKLNEERVRANRYNHSIALLYFDVDNFKDLNDSFGHQFGDEVLKKIVMTIKGALRGMDVVARLGGDEFAVLMPQADEKGANAAADRVGQNLKKNVSSLVTVSIGIAIFPKMPDSNTEMIKIADDAMYHIKRARHAKMPVSEESRE